jgi:hypothetical protein
MSASRVQSAVALLDEKSGLPTNTEIIAECIRQELHEARDCDEAAVEAEQRVMSMLVREIVNVRIITPFRITETTNFDRWSVTVQYPVGEPLTIDQNS